MARKHLFLVLTLLCPLTWARFDPPLKIVTCELLLRSSLHDLSTIGGAVAGIQQNKYRVQTWAGQDSQESFNSVFYDGPYSRLSGRTGHDILRRLNGLESNLTKSKPNMQIVVLEFRGDNIREALEVVRTSEPELREAYQKNRADTLKIGDQLVGVANNALIFFAGATQFFVTAESIGTLASQPSLANAGATLVDAGILLFPLAVAKMAIQHNIGRRDWQFPLVMNSLVEMINSPPRNRIIFAGSRVDLPFRYHRMLMNYSPTPELVREGRAAGIRALGTGLTLKFLSQISSGQFFGPDNGRRAYLDQIAFFDLEKREPVWIVVYRAFRPERD